MAKESIDNSDDKVIQLIGKSFEIQKYEGLETVLDASKGFLKTLKLENHQIDRLVGMTKDTLQRVLNQQNNGKKIINQELGGYPLYKLPNESTKYVSFSVKSDIINVLFSELLDSPEDTEKINNINKHMEETRYRGGRVDPTADTILRS